MLTGKHLMWHVEHKRLYLENRLSAIEVRLKEIEGEKAKLKAERDRKRKGLKNLLDYSPTHGTDFLCPDCWAKGVQTVLESIGDPAKEDIYRCPDCPFEIEVPAESETARTDAAEGCRRKAPDLSKN